jgi:hypothetical protein
MQQSVKAEALTSSASGEEKATTIVRAPLDTPAGQRRRVLPWYPTDPSLVFSDKSLF